MFKRVQIATLACTSAIALFAYMSLPAPVTVGQGQGQGRPGVAQQIAPIGYGEWDVEDRDEETINSFQPVALPVPDMPFRPTMDAASYAAAKSSAAAYAAAGRADSGNAPTPQAPLISAVGYAGGTQADNAGVGQPSWYPPDTAGAVGTTQFVQAHNAYIRVYNKTGGFVSTKSLQALMGYTTEYLFDPRVVWDPYWGRWVITAIAFPESASVQRFFIAVSKTASAGGGYWVFSTNTVGFTASGAFWDYAALGIDQDSMIITANVFGTSSFLGAYMFPLSKAQHYNGRGQGFPVFGGLHATLMPAMMPKTDLNGYAWLSAAAAGGIRMYALRDSSRPNAVALFGPYTVAGVGAYSIPPSADQPSPCLSYNLDTLDARFVNLGYQAGDRYYQVHSIAAGPAAVRYYVISGLLSFAPTVAESGTFFRSGSSADFNASIASNTLNDLVMTYSSSDAATLPQMRVVGRTSGSAAISGTGGGQIFFAASATCLTGNGGATQRWGDYSQTSLDPSVTTQKRFWITNERVISASTWGSAFGRVNF